MKYERSREKNTPFYFQSSENRSEEKKIFNHKYKKKIKQVDPGLVMCVCVWMGAMQQTLMRGFKNRSIDQIQSIWRERDQIRSRPIDNEDDVMSDTLKY